MTAAPESIQSKKRLHRSSVMLAFCFAIPYLLVAIPGKFLTAMPEYAQASGVSKNHTVAIYGWPAVHCIANHEPEPTLATEALDHRRVADTALFGTGGQLSAKNINSVIWANDHKITNKFLFVDFEFWGPACPESYKYPNFWSDVSRWKYFGAGIWPRWSPIGLLINLLCFATFLAVVAFSFEFSRRRKKHFFQITILDSFVAIGITALVVAWFTHQYQRANSIRKSIETARTIASFPSHFHFRTHFPTWFERLTDGRFDKQGKDNWQNVSGARMPPSRLPLGCSNIRTRIYDITDAKPVINFIEQARTISEIGLAADKTETLYEVIESLDPNFLQGIEIGHLKPFDVSTLANKHELKSMMLSVELQLSELKEPGFAEVEWLRFKGTDPKSRISDLIHSMPRLNTLWCSSKNLHSINTLPAQLKSLSLLFGNEEHSSDSTHKLSNLSRLDLTALVNGRNGNRLPREIGINLEKLSKLKRLTLNGFALDDTTIERLNSIPNLEYVILRNHRCRLPDDQLKQAVPEIVIGK